MIELNWAAFTPWLSLFGGLLIGLSATLMIVLLGRVAGISGIMGGLIRPAQGDIAWRAAFLLGLCTAPWAYHMLMGAFPFENTSSWPVLIVSGLLVGYGTRLGSGCTSGHGVCGLSRLSPRSAVATLTFMVCGFWVATLIRPFVI